MKHLPFFFIILLITACSGTKRVVENNYKETAESKPLGTNILEEEKAIDSMEEVIEKSIDKPTIVPVKKESIDKHNTVAEAFNHKAWGDLLQKHVSKKGNVNYQTFKTDRKELLNYLRSLSENLPNDSWIKEDKLAYWINAYNAMTVDLILRNYPIKSIKDIKDPWGQRLWKLGEKWYNLNDIEHNILRKMEEPRIHFAIVCASYSCPKLLNEAYTASNLDNQLSNATKVFLSDTNRNSISENKLEVSKIFQWFTKDFKQNGSLIDFIDNYSEVSILENAKISYKYYNWDLNE